MEIHNLVFGYHHFNEGSQGMFLLRNKKNYPCIILKSLFNWSSRFSLTGKNLLSLFWKDPVAQGSVYPAHVMLKQRTVFDLISAHFPISAQYDNV